MDQFYELLRETLADGEMRGDRTGTGTHSVFGRLIRFDLQRSFPLLTGKFVPFRSVAAELLFFLNGQQDNKILKTQKCNIWNPWELKEDYYETKRNYRDPSSVVIELATKLQKTFNDTVKILNDADVKAAQDGTSDNSEAILRQHDVHAFEEFTNLRFTQGELGPIYGVQWRNFTAIDPDGVTRSCDQFQDIVELLRVDPYTRRAVVVAWQPNLLPKHGVGVQENIQQGRMALAPCHYAYQWYVSFKNPEKPTLSLMYVMRSNDLFIGAPFNIASYALLVHLVARELGYAPGELIAVTGDTHIYKDHVDQVTELLARYDAGVPELPQLNLPENMNLSNVTLDAIVESLEEYHPLGKIAAPIAV